MAKLLKNLYNKEFIKKLSSNLKNADNNFQVEKFESVIFNNEWEEKELKQRMRYISTTLCGFLPYTYEKQIDILKKVFDLKQENQALENMIFQDFVEVFGLDFFEVSMKALEYFTQESSSEFAIRHFLLRYQEKTMLQMKIWSKSSSEHTRRLSSEGCRPRLPWAIALPRFKKNPTLVLDIIEILKNDKSKYVQKSVANNLNDISKDNPSLVIIFTKENIGKTKNLDWILKHGCRTLLKAGNLEVLNIFGFILPNKINISNVKVLKEVKMGNDLEFSFSLSSKENLGKLRIEYALHFVRTNGKTNKKVFAIKEGIYQEKKLEIDKKYSFKKISTRKYYIGLHKIELIVNGINLYEENFYLL